MEITNPNPNIPPSSSTSFGAMLSRARERKQVTLEDASAELFILKRHLQALEQENFEALPQLTFARGFAINYAKYLGLDPHVVAESFDAAYPNALRTKSVGDIESPLRPMGTLQREGRSKIRFNPLLLLAIIAVIALAVFLLRMVTNARETPTQPAQITDTITPTEQAEGAAVDNAGVAIGSTSSTTSTTPAETATTNAGVAIGNNATSLTAEQLANTADATLEFWVRDNTDISVVDATGKSLLSGEQPRGGYNLVGKPPFQVQIKDVKNVTLNMNKEKISLAEHATNNQASFSLAP